MPSQTSDNPHDHFLTQQLPLWALHLTPGHWQDLRHSLRPVAIEQQDLPLQNAQARLKYLRNDLHHLLKDLKGLVAFSQPLLKAHLHQVVHTDLDVERTTLHRVTLRYNGPVTNRSVEELPHSLLQAALQNFSSVSFDAPSALRDADNKRLSIPPQRFAQACRTLDLGQRYQQHLRDIFETGTTAQQIEQRAVELNRQQLRVDLQLAQLHQRISAAGTRWVSNLFAPQAPTRAGGFPLHRWSLKMFGVPLHDIVVLAPSDASTESTLNTGKTQVPGVLLRPWRPAWQKIFSQAPPTLALVYSGPLVAWLPGARDGALCEFTSAQALQNHLRQCLCNAEFRRFFARFVPLQQRTHFFAVLKRNLAPQAAADADWPVAAGSSLYLLRQLITTELFSHLQTAHVQRLKNEARFLAVPTADADENARTAMLEAVWDNGLNFLNVAAFFVPGLGQVMMAVFAVQLLESAYEGFDAWSHGDIDTALAQLQSIGVNLALSAGLAAGGHLISAGNRVIDRRLMDSLVQVQRGDGSQRLWSPDITAYRSHVELPERLESNAQGQYLHDNKHYVRMAGNLFEHRLDAHSGQWRIIAPSKPHAYQPPLLHNNEGAWRHVHEQPLQWSRATLLRRLGQPVEAFSDEQLSQAAWISGTTEDSLRRLHLEQQAAPALLLDSLRRLHAAKLGNEALQRQPQASFPQLFSEHYQGPPAGVRPEQLTLARALEGLYEPRLANDDCERLVFACLKRLHDWPTDFRLELRAGHLHGPRIAYFGPSTAAERALIVKVAATYQAFRGGAPLAPATPNRYQAILSAIPRAEREQKRLEQDDGTLLGHNVRRLSENNQNSLNQWLWSYSPDWNEAIGLSGGAPLPPRIAPTHASSIGVTRYRALYPESSDSQAQAALQAWRAAGTSPFVVLLRLEQQFLQLRLSLQIWARNLSQRLEVTTRLLNVWRRRGALQSAAGQSVFVLDFDDLALAQIDLESFPVLQGNPFEHVQELSIDNNPLSHLPSQFMRYLPQLRSLSARDCELTRVPSGLSNQLRSLDLTLNEIDWSADDQNALAAYPRLQHLHLDGNALALAPDVGGLPDLRRVTLSSCTLEELPPGIDSLRAPVLIDLSGNRLARLPLDFDPPRAVGHALQLENNPLDLATRRHIRRYFADHRVDMQVSQSAYAELLNQASDSQLQLWERLQTPARLTFVRGLRDLYSSTPYLAAPDTTRRMLWQVLEVIEAQPHSNEVLSEHSGGTRILLLAAQVQTLLATQTPGLQARSTRVLHTALQRMYRQVLHAQVDNQIPALAQQQPLRRLRCQVLYHWTLRQLAFDPQMVMTDTPLPGDRLRLNAIESDLQNLPPDWPEQLHERMVALNPDSDSGLQALFERDEQHDFVNQDWVTQLQSHFAEQFADLDDELSQRLQAVGEEITDPDALGREQQAVRRRHQHEVERVMRELTRLFYRDSLNEE
ncbi:dermonecrotic toxin domain-containing protein [Pseudomonas sp. Irchel 3F5]|uniref:dermonecrotic toxin domain-containing protein n=1 Tax=Pseudomonas sp. Irchel 3F5 TaxID=2009002 RepID=UPI000BA4785F|nr:DUF6543 domain-containing protein [Pseudomonas sp. Irchel 3F5]